MARGDNNSAKADIPKLKFTKDNLKEGLLIFRYVRPYRARFIGGLVFITLSSLTTMAFPYLLKQLIDSAHGMEAGTAKYTPTQIALVMIGVLSLRFAPALLERTTLGRASRSSFSGTARASKPPTYPRRKRRVP